jgi:hypothetical protein
MFEVSDRVRDSRDPRKIGTITDIIPRSTYPLRVQWDEGGADTYTAVGRLFTSDKSVGITLVDTPVPSPDVRYTIRNSKLIYESPHENELLVVVELDEIRLLMRDKIHYATTEGTILSVPENVVEAIADYLIHGEEI